MAVDTPPVAGDTSEPLPPAAQPYTPPASTSFYPPPPPLAPLPPRAARRRGLWYASLVVALVVTLGGLGLLYQDDISWQHQAASLNSQNATLREQLATTQTDLRTAVGTITELKTAAQHPNLGIWNVPQRIDGPDYYLLGNVPDTFTYHLSATSTGPMSVSILTIEQYAAGIGCVHNGGGNTNYCMHHSGAVQSWLSVTSVSSDFHLGEGCADYVVIFTAASAVTVHPDVSVTYNPAPTVTGVCGS